jgi:hypothetical protein
MKYYIWIDSQGEEIRREPKGRGRNKPGAVLNEKDGNWYITESGPIIQSERDEVVVNNETSVS